MKKNNAIKYVLALSVLLSGCSSMNKDALFDIDNNLFAKKDFVVVSMNGIDMGENLNMTMGFPKIEVVSGRGFCNLYIGNYSVENNFFEFSNIKTTSKSCVGLKLAYEDIFKKIVSKKLTIIDTPLGYMMGNDIGTFQIMEVSYKNLKK